MTVILRLAKGPEARFISHLDLTRVLERALRRAGLPLAYSSGFNPHPRIAFCSALALGATSEGELVEVGLTQPVAPGEVERRLNAQLPAGVAVLAAREAPPGNRALARGLRWAAYRLRVQGGGGVPGAWPAAVRRFLEAPTWPVEQGRSRDVRPLVGRLEVSAEDGEGADLLAVLRCTPEGTLRPEELVRALAPLLPGDEASLVSVHRLELLGEGEGGFVPLWEAKADVRG